MTRAWMICGISLAVLAACEEPEPPAPPPTSSEVLLQRFPDVPSKAAPGQNLTDLQIDPVDNCFLYRYDGPVETTYLPLRTPGGNPICIVVPAEGEVPAPTA